MDNIIGKGLKNYELLGEIFNNTIAIGTLHHTLIQKPPTSNKEREMEEAFLSRGMHVNPRNGENSQRIVEGGGTRHDFENNLCCKASSEFGDRSTKKVAKMSKMDSYLDIYSMALVAKTEANKAKMKKYKAETSNVTTTALVSNPSFY